MTIKIEAMNGDLPQPTGAILDSIGFERFRDELERLHRTLSSEAVLGIPRAQRQSPCGDERKRKVHDHAQRGQ